MSDNTKAKADDDKQTKALTAKVARLEKDLADAITRLTVMEKTMAAIKAVFVPRGGGDVEPADDAELDGRYGDPEIRRDPSQKYWDGPSYKGCRLSEAPPEYLKAFITYKLACSVMAAKDPERAKYAEYDRRDAARAKGWLLRMQSGAIQPPTQARPRTGFAGSDSGGGFTDTSSASSFDTGFDPGRAAGSFGDPNDGGGFGGGETGFESGDAGDDEIPF